MLYVRAGRAPGDTNDHDAYMHPFYALLGTYARLHLAIFQLASCCEFEIAAGPATLESQLARASSTAVHRCLVAELPWFERICVCVHSAWEG